MLSDRAQTVLDLLQRSDGWIIKVENQSGQLIHLTLYDASGQLTDVALRIFDELVNEGLLRCTQAQATPNGQFTLFTYRAHL